MVGRRRASPGSGASQLPGSGAGWPAALRKFAAIETAGTEESAPSMSTATAMSPTVATNQPCAGPDPTSAVPVLPASPGI